MGIRSCGTDARQVARSITFAGQTELPRLPIPTLDETLNKFVEVMKALQSPKEQDETKAIVEDFRRGDGPELQDLLIEYERQGRENNTLGSYVESFWNDSYLAPDQSVVLNLNPYFVLEEGPDPKIAKDQIRRAAALTFASVKLASLLKHHTLAPDVFKGKPLCMDQFKVLFGSARVPHRDTKDSVEVYPESTHVAVLCRNQMFYFQALWPDGTVAVDETDITDILYAIQKNARDTSSVYSSKLALGVLTSLPRNEWAIARHQIASYSSQNTQALEIIDSAIFVLVLDDFSPSSASETAANMLHGTYKMNEKDEQIGTCCNRWYDKLQVIVCGDGTAGGKSSIRFNDFSTPNLLVNFEHSAIDGHTALRFVSDIVAETIVVFAQSITRLVHGIGRVPSVINATIKRAALTLDHAGAPKHDVFPKKLVFDLPTAVIEKIYFAETALGDEIVSCENVVLEFAKFGKKLIVANSLSPDAFVQMSIILAYFRLYGKIVCTYEPVMTKSFYHGRTEAQRSATPLAAEFCRVWCSNNASIVEKLDALRKATNEHSRLVAESANGKGVDRHLFALKCIAEMENLPLPKFFASKPWKTLNHTILSTSNCGNPSLRMFGFGPGKFCNVTLLLGGYQNDERSFLKMFLVVPDGFGLGYIIKDNALSYCVSSKHRQTQRYVNMLHKILLEFEELLKPASTIEVSGIKALTKRHGSLRDVKVPQHVLDTFDDFYGESTPHATKTADAERPDGTTKATSYFAIVKRKSTLRANLLSRIGLNVKLSSDPLDENSD